VLSNLFSALSVCHKEVGCLKHHHQVCVPVQEFALKSLGQPREALVSLSHSTNAFNHQSEMGKKEKCVFLKVENPYLKVR